MVIEEGAVVVDAGCGSGVLSIVAAKLGARMVYGVDAASKTVAIATANASAQGVSDRTAFYEGDMFGPIPDGVEADVVIGDVSGIPDDLATVSGWFPSGLSGGPSGAELPMRMLDEAKRILRRGGKLLLPTGTLQDENSILDKARSLFGSIRQLSERSIPRPLPSSPRSSVCCVRRSSSSPSGGAAFSGQPECGKYPAEGGSRRRLRPYASGLKPEL
jgi:methylase of polypeptide subunit release factors